MQLDKKHKKKLLELAHSMSPVVMLSEKKGVTDNVLKAIDEALLHHELIKIKVSFMLKADRAKVIQEISEKFTATVLREIGKVAILYRFNPELDKHV
ncbi:MAG: ribosome assembly RNA-binding protein YhbY [Legionellales bacterium]|nr:MAG: ribosome assembly RNA-binding protein YhbY [Legionellales bacterium]